MKMPSISNPLFNVLSLPLLQRGLKYYALLYSLSAGASPSGNRAVEGRSIEVLSSLFHNIFLTVYQTLNLPT